MSTARLVEDKVVVVTGAGGGIGRDLALAMAREGARVMVSDLNVVGGQETLALLKAQGADALFEAADVGNVEHHRQLVARTVAGGDDAAAGHRQRQDRLPLATD